MVYAMLPAWFIIFNYKGKHNTILVERLRESLHKKVDLLDINQVVNNAELLNEVLKEGVKIYG